MTGEKRQRQYTTEEIVAALEATGGDVARAARKLGCHRTLLYLRFDEDEELRKLRDRARRGLFHHAEATLGQLLNSKDPAIRARVAIHITSTLGKQEGYAQRQELTGPAGAPVAVEIQYVNDWRAGADPEPESDAEDTNE